MLIASASNPLIKQIRALRARKAREEAGVCWAEGIRIVAAAVEHGAAIERLVVAPDLLTSAYARDLAAAQRARGVPYTEVSAAVFASLSLKEGPQGIGAVVRQRWTALDTLAPGGELCWIALDAAQDPGNLGTILRTGDAVGAAGIILLGHAADAYDAAALRASMGAIFAQRLVRASFAELIDWKTRHSAALIGTSDAAPTDYQALRYPHPAILLMGSERQGLAPDQQAACDHLVRIPMTGTSDSLNLAVATAVALYEIYNQRRHASMGTPAGGDAGGSDAS
ncbi:MAG TPA: RNA methyltransferase [Ktedonobacterales bacterium]|jgi:TrmH family RNA methyltransferase